MNIVILTKYQYIAQPYLVVCLFCACINKFGTSLKLYLQIVAGFLYQVLSVKISFRNKFWRVDIL